MNWVVSIFLLFHVGNKNVAALFLGYTALNWLRRQIRHHLGNFPNFCCFFAVKRFGPQVKINHHILKVSPTIFPFYSSLYQYNRISAVGWLSIFPGVSLEWVDRPYFRLHDSWKWILCFRWWSLAFLSGW